MTIVSRLRAWIRAKGGSAEKVETIEQGVKELAKLDSAEEQQQTPAPQNPGT